MASQISNHDGAAETKKTSKKAPKRGIKNPFVYGGTIVILIITVIAFVFIPSLGGGLSSSGSAPKFGSWNGKPITYTSGSYFASQVAQLNDYLRQQGLSEENFQLYAYQVWSMAFQSAAIRTALLDTVEASGFRVTEKGLDEAVAELAEFQVDGKFSLEKYNSVTKAARLELRNTTKNDLLIRRYYEDLYTMAPSSAEISFVAAMAKPQRSIAYVTLPLSDFPAEEVAAWGAKNADLFRSFELSRITITSSEADAKKILAQVKENKLSFEDAAKSHSQDAYSDKGGDAGSVFFHVFAEDFSNKDDAAKVASLAKGEISDVYAIGEKTWAFFKINGELTQPNFAKQATLDEARFYINDKERGTLESWAIEKAGNVASVADTAAFRTAARKAGYEVKSAGPFIINVGNPTFYAYNQQIPLLQTPFQNSDPALQAAEQDEAFMVELFAKAKGGVSKPLVVSDSVIVFTVTDDAEASDDDTAMVKFAYPYFLQQTVDAATRDTFLKSKKFKDEFNTTFFKVFQTNDTASTTQETTTTAAPAAN
ncbi:MAG: SurA N-terminal domain-containing protein [Rectinemataceae bacterium]